MNIKTFNNPTNCDDIFIVNKSKLDHIIQILNENPEYFTEKIKNGDFYNKSEFCNYNLGFGQ